MPTIVNGGYPSADPSFDRSGPFFFNNKPYNVWGNEFEGVDATGYLDGIASAQTDVDIWDNGGSYTGYMAANTTLTISSTDAADAFPAGTGTTAVLVSGLKANNDSLWQETSEVVLMNGLTPVTLANQYIRINSLQSALQGSGNNANVGNIYVGYGTVTAGVPATVVARMRPRFGTSLMALYTLPDLSAAGKRYTRYQAVSWFATVGSTGGSALTAIVALQARLQNLSWGTLYTIAIPSGASINKPVTFGIPSTGKLDFRVRMKSTSSNNTAVTSTVSVRYR